MWYKVKRIMMRPNGVEKQVRPPNKTFTCYIDESKSDPSQMVTYWDDVPYSAWSSEWDSFFWYYPCLLNSNWEETAKLDTNNYTKDINWNSVNITSGDNVMVCFPRLWIKMSKSWSIITLQITNDSKKDWFSYLAHSRVNSDKDKFYVWAYKAYNSNNVLKSWSWVSPSTYIWNDNARTYSRANGTWYEMFAFYQKTFIQALYIMKYKNLNSQATVWYGYVWWSSRQNTWATNTSGMNYWNTSSTTDRVKLFWIEDLRWNIFEWCEWYYGTGSNHYISYDNFDYTQSNYSTTFSRSEWSWWIQNVYWTSQLWFMSSVSWWSATTYYCDSSVSDAGTHIPFMWWFWANWTEAWIFRFYANNASSSWWYNDIWARIMYL